MEHAPQRVIDGKGAKKPWPLPARDLQDSKGNRPQKEVSKLWSINVLDLKRMFVYMYMYIYMLICML